MMNMTPLHRPVAGILSAIFLAGALTGCAESDFDKARKPELIERAVATSLQRCDTQDKKPQEIPYQARLRLVLATTDSAALDKLHDNGTAICMDQRLSKQNDVGFWSLPIKGIYYADQNIVSVWDNGRNPDTQSWYETDITDWGSRSLEKFADTVSGTDAAASMQVGSTYSCGKSCVTWKWKEAAEFSKQLEKNPVLKEAPAARAESFPSGSMLTARLN
jgi:hypothetical protein